MITIHPIFWSIQLGSWQGKVLGPVVRRNTSTNRQKKGTPGDLVSVGREGFPKWNVSPCRFVPDRGRLSGTWLLLIPTIDLRHLNTWPRGAVLVFGSKRPEKDSIKISICPFVESPLSPFFLGIPLRLSPEFADFGNLSTMVNGLRWKTLVKFESPGYGCLEKYKILKKLSVWTKETWNRGWEEGF